QTGVHALREFCLLRAESVCGRLEATIPATSGGQAAGSASAIDASHNVISDVASLNGGGVGAGRGGVGGLRGGGQFPLGSGDVESGEEATAQEETSQGWGTGRTPPSGQSPLGEAPAGEEAGSLSEESLTTPETGGAAGERSQAPESAGNQTPPG